MRLTLTIRCPNCRNQRTIDMRHSQLLISDNGLVVPANGGETCAACRTHHRPGVRLPYADPRRQPSPIRPALSRTLVVGAAAVLRKGVVT